MRPNLHGGSIRRPLRTSYIVVGTRRRPPSQNPPLAKWQHAKPAPRSQNAVAPTTTLAQVPSTTTSQRIPRQLVPKNSPYIRFPYPQISLHIRPGYSVPPSTHLLSKTIRPTNHENKKNKFIHSKTPSQSPRAVCFPLPLRVQEAGGNDHHLYKSRAAYRILPYMPSPGISASAPT